MLLPPLDETRLHHAARELASRDPDLARVLDQFGTPPLWARPATFATLVHIILEQQVSLASANAAFARLQAAASPLTPAAFLALDDETLRAIGFSRQKSRYARLLAEAIGEGKLNLSALAAADDETARASLTQIKGIGPWTADIYLMEALLRPDIWPVGDLALANAAQTVKGLAQRPDPATMQELGKAWQPWRAVAARILWHHYLSTKGTT